VCSNQQGIPKEIASTTQEVKRHWQGESVFHQKGNLAVTVWKDKKPVYFLSTHWILLAMMKLIGGTSYNSNMGGIDLSDQLRGYYMSGRKSKKWWHCLPWFFEDTSIVNGYILETLLRNNCNRTQIWLAIFLLEDCRLVLSKLKGTGLYLKANGAASIAQSGRRILSAEWLQNFAVNTFVWSAFGIMPRRISCEAPNLKFCFNMIVYFYYLSKRIPLGNVKNHTSHVFWPYLSAL